MSRTEQFVAAMISGWAMPSRTETYQEYVLRTMSTDSEAEYNAAVEKMIANERDALKIVVERAITLDKLLAEHERAEITPPNFCSECGGPWDKLTVGFEHVACCSKRDRT